jgi:hypothetical protein
MRNLLAVLCVVTGLLMALPADASTFTFEEAKVTVDVPDSWETDPQPGYVTFATTDGTLAVNLAFSAISLDDSWDLLVKQVNNVVSGMTVTKKAGVLSAMSGYVDSGKGKFSGGDVSCLLGVVKTPTGMMTIFVLGQTGTYEKHNDEMNQILHHMEAFGARTGGEIAMHADLAPDAQAFVTSLATAIHASDATAFLALVSPKGLSVKKPGAKKKTIKAAKLKKAIAKAPTVAGYLGIPAVGGWTAYPLGATIELYRGDSPGVVTVLKIAKVKGAWMLTGTVTSD